jgi:uncharacterized membrane protein
VGLVEKIKIAAAFASIGLLIVAPALSGDVGAGIFQAGEIVLGIAAGLTLVTLVQSWMRALRAFREN